jgi:hypothetical protein
MSTAAIIAKFILHGLTVVYNSIIKSYISLKLCGSTPTVPIDLRDIAKRQLLLWS